MNSINWPKPSAPLINDGGYIALPFTDIKLPESIEVRRETFYSKSEYHCSLVCVKCIAEQLVERDVDHADAAQQITDIVEEVRLQSEPTFIKYLDEFRLVEKEGRKTIAVMVQMDGLEPIFEALRNKLQLEIPTQPTHVTIMCTKRDAGIGIRSQADLDKTILLDNSEVEDLRVALKLTQ